MIKKKTKKMAAFLAAVLMAALCLCQAAFAAETKSAGIEERGSTLSIDLEGQDKRATMALYQIGDWDGEQGAYVLNGTFAGSGVDLAELMAGDGMTTQEMEDTCAALVAYAEAKGITAQEVKDTEEGRLTFGPVGNGLYLVAQTGEDSAFQVAPFFTTLPRLEDEGWDYQVEAQPKNAVVPVPPAEVPTEAPTQSGNGSTSGGSSTRRSSGAANTINAEAATDTIEDEATPLGEQIIDTIEDALTPLASLLPKTGDRSVAYLPLFLAFLASGAGIVLFAVKRKQYV